MGTKTDCEMRVACCVLRVAGCGLRVARCGLRDADCEMRVACCGLRVAGCALRDDKAQGVEQSAWGEKTEIRWLRVVGYVLQVAR